MAEQVLKVIVIHLLAHIMYICSGQPHMQ